MTHQRFISHPLIYPNSIDERIYQTKIAKNALDGNTLVILPTALGKTIISAIVVAELIYKYRDSRILIMAPTRPLVIQHKQNFEKIIRLPEDQFVLLTGKTPAEYRLGVWAGSSRVIFATPQVVRNDLLNNRVSLKDFNLLVFDECHRSVKEYAYTEVAKQYAINSLFPLILGMTASPGSDLKRIKTVCESLFIERIEFRTDEDSDVRAYINTVKLEWVKTTLPPHYQPLNEILSGMLQSTINIIRLKGLIKKQTSFVSRKDLIELGNYLRYQAEISIDEEKGPKYAAISTQSQALTLFHMIELLNTQGVYTLDCFLKRLDGNTKRSHNRIINDAAFKSLVELLKGQCYKEHPKLLELIKIVSKQITKNPDSRILIFTQYRDTASHIVDELNKIRSVQAKRFVGQASKINDKGLSQDQQASLIDDLRKGNINTLCATSIAEEGLDIPEVDLVIFYEPIPSEIRYIQRRGRTGRRSAGVVIILATDNTTDMAYLYISQQRTIKMKNIIGKINNKLKPVLRLRPRPTINPMTKAEIKEIKNNRTEPPPFIAHDLDKIKLDQKKITKIEENLYLKILKSGLTGLKTENTYSEMEEEGISRNYVNIAIERLVKKKRLFNNKQRLVPVIKNFPSTKMKTIEIIKILPGEALLKIDDKIDARLNPANYNGPKQLIKKSSKFKALCELYQFSGSLYVQIMQVVQIL